MTDTMSQHDVFKVEADRPTVSRVRPTSLPKSLLREADLGARLLLAAEEDAERQAVRLMLQTDLKSVINDRLIPDPAWQAGTITQRQLNILSAFFDHHRMTRDQIDALLADSAHEGLALLRFMSASLLLITGYVATRPSRHAACARVWAALVDGGQAGSLTPAWILQR